MDRRAEEGIDRGERVEAEGLREQLRRELTPVGVLQGLLVDQIARAAWRLRRAAEWEETTGPEDRGWLRYQGQAERSFYRGLAELRRLVKAEARGDGAKVGAVIEGRGMVDSPAVTARPDDRGPSPQLSAGVPGEGTKPGVGADPAPFARYNVPVAGGEGTVHWRPVAETVQGDPPAQPPRISSMLSGAGAYSSGSML